MVLAIINTWIVTSVGIGVEGDRIAFIGSMEQYENYHSPGEIIGEAILIFDLAISKTSIRA